MRLVFHDCMRYQDGTGGCDGCINFKVHIFLRHPRDFFILFKVDFKSLSSWAFLIEMQGVGHAGPSPHNKDDYYKTKPINETDNNGMDQVDIMISYNKNNKNVPDHDEAGVDLHHCGLAVQEREHERKSLPTG